MEPSHLLNVLLGGILLGGLLFARFFIGSMYLAKEREHYYRRQHTGIGSDGESLLWIFLVIIVLVGAYYLWQNPTINDSLNPSPANESTLLPDLQVSFATLGSAPATNNTSQITNDTSSPAWYWQLGAYELPEAADDWQAELEQAGWPTTLFPPQAGDRRPVWRLVLGPFGSAEEARRVGKDAGVEGFVRER